MVSSHKVTTTDEEETSIENINKPGDISYLQIITSMASNKKIKNGIQMDFEIGQSVDGRETILSTPSALVKSGVPTKIELTDLNNKKISIQILAKRKK